MARINTGMMLDDNFTMSTILETVVGAILNSDAVMSTPANQSPSLEQVQDIASQLIETITPIVAPNQVIDQNYLNQVAETVALEIVNNPTVIKTGEGQPVPSSVIDKIVTAVTPDAQRLASLSGQKLTESDGDAYYTAIVGNTGKTSAQLNAEEEAKKVAEETGGIFDEETGFVFEEGTSTKAIEEFKDSVAAAEEAGETPPLPESTVAAINAANEVNNLAASITTPALTGADRGDTGPGGVMLDSGQTPVAPTGPTGTGPVGPTGIGPTVTGPTVTGPTVTGPTVTGPVGTGPTGPTITGPTGPIGTTEIDTGTITATSTLTTPSALTYKASDGTVFTDQAAYVAYQKILTDKKATDDALSAENAKNRQSAYDLLYAEFSKYGLGSLVQPLQGLIQSGASPAEFSLKLRESDAYQKRFSANKARISKGLTAISEAEYIGLEDQYQNILRNAGLPESYWKQTVDPRTGIVSQEGFSNFIANDVSAVELEDRVSTAQQRLIYANPEVSIALKTFYPDISNGDLLAYALDPTKGLEQIKRRITAAEIGSSAVQMGLTTNVTDAEYLARYGVTKAQAQQGYRTAAEVLPTASKLGDIYSRQGLGAYTQQTAEQEIFNVPGAAEAAAKRKKLVGLEQAAFSGKAGAAQGALARERAGNF